MSIAKEITSSVEELDIAANLLNRLKSILEEVIDEIDFEEGLCKDNQGAKLALMHVRSTLETALDKGVTYQSPYKSDDFKRLTKAETNILLAALKEYTETHQEENRGDLFKKLMHRAWSAYAHTHPEDGPYK